VAATIRASTLIVRLPPSRLTCRCSITRSSFACAGSGSSPISSRNSVPPAAASNAPLRSTLAPVKAPRSCPNSSSSTRLSGSAPLLRAMKGPFGLAPRRCTSWATSSFPDPLSPTISTGLGILATRVIASLSRCMARLAPTRGGVGAGALAQGGDLSDEALSRERVLDLLHDPLHRFGLVDEALGAQPDRLGAAIVVARPGVDDHGSAEAAPLHRPQYLEAVHARH